MPITVPDALAAVCADLAAGEVRVHGMFEGTSHDLLNWQPPGGGWSALQCIQHLTLANGLLSGAIACALEDVRAVEQASSLITPGPIWRVLLAMVEPNVRLKGFAPAVLKPSVTLDARVVITEYGESHQLLYALAERSRGIDLNRKRLRHLVVHLRMSVGCVFLLVTAHER